MDNITDQKKQVIENIRKIRFGIGLDTINLTKEHKDALVDKQRILKDASKLAKEIHTKNPHFIFELIQNAEDNEYGEGVKHKIRFIIDSDCLIVQNNEKGFEEKNVWALCGIGETTKKNKALSYIGEKGIGFKSVFMIASKVHIYSNGFQFGFNYDENNPISMIIPEWIDDHPNFVDPDQTNIVLYPKPEIRNEISNYIEEIHPSLLLFLRKLKVIEIEERDKNKVKRMEKYEKDGIVKIVYGEKKRKKSHWKVVRKPLGVDQDINEERRKDIRETEIILAFPLNEDNSPDTSNEQYVFAFLPVRKYGFRFIIQADFLLPITREDVIKDNKWNEWLRDSIVDVFLDAVRKFKNDEKLKYSFYDYLFQKEVKDDFFLPLVKQIYERLKEEDCILTDANRWKRPSEVLIGDEEIKKIVPNEDLQKFFGKGYLSDRIKADKSVLHELGVRDFSIDDLIECLEKTEWVKKQNDEWFANLFRYLSKRELSDDEQLAQLKNLNIIKLENGELTSIKDGTVFFPFKKEITYGFESELRIIKKDIIDAISKDKKEDRESILEFLKKIGLKQAASYEIIENHILPVYESGEWKRKDPRVLIGYIRYIKDNIDKYEKESDRRLNADKASLKPKEDPLKRLKKSLLIRIDKDVEGKEWYNNPENVYLPRIYGNENDLEKLFEGIDVSFVHPCYIEDVLEKLDKEINELENKLKEKSKKWKKKHRKEVKKIEKLLKEIKERKEKVIAEWKNFFGRIGVNTFLRVEKDPETENPRYWYVGLVTQKYIPPWKKKNTLWKDEDWVDAYEGYYIGDDWISNDFKKIVENIEYCNDETRKIKISKILFQGFDQNWEKYKKYLKCHYYYRYYGQSQPAWTSIETKSTFLLMLQNLQWVPTTKGLHKPNEVFLDSEENRGVLGDTIPYLAVKIENEDFIKTLGINTQANIDGVLNYLKALIEQKNEDKEKFEKLYKFLDVHFEEDSIKIREEFAKNPLILVPGTEKEYYSSKEIIWRDVSNIFGKNRIYLEKYYPKLRKFFVEKLAISEKPTPKDYADVLCSISEKSEISNEDKKIIVRIYEELNRNLNPDKVENPISQEDWWNDFVEKPIFLTDKGEFWSNDGDIFISDNNELYELFKDEKDIGFLWLPEGDHPEKIKFFIKSCGLRYLSESVDTKPLLEETEYSKDEKLTQRIQTVVQYVLRYLYWKENTVYDELKKSRMFEKIGTVEVYVTDNLKVEYSISVNEWKRIDKIADRDCILFDSRLYILANDTSIYRIATEFSKIFGEIKGLDDFLMNIMTNLSQAEDIMRAKSIDELPKSEKELWEECVEVKEKDEETTEKVEEKEQSPENKSKEDYFPEEHMVTKPAPKPTAEDVDTTQIDEESRNAFDETEEKEWRPEFSPEEVPINVEEYIIPEQKIEEVTEKEIKPIDKKSPVDKSPAPATYENIKTPAETLSKKDIGRWGEEYALYSLIKDKLFNYFNIKIGEHNTFEDILEHHANIVKETNKGFNIEKDGGVIVEVIWLNKYGESGEHYDIKIIENGEEIFIEVKSTKEYTKAYFQMTKDEWRLMKEKEDKFYIYRVFGAGTKEVNIKKIHNPAKQWEDGSIDAYPIGIEI